MAAAQQPSAKTTTNPLLHNTLSSVDGGEEGNIVSRPEDSRIQVATAKKKYL
jgi:hypothetical protein